MEGSGTDDESVIASIQDALDKLVFEYEDGTWKRGHGFGMTRNFAIDANGMPWVECLDSVVVEYDDGGVADYKTCVPTSVVVSYDGAVRNSMGAIVASESVTTSNYATSATNALNLARYATSRVTIVEDESAGMKTQIEQNASDISSTVSRVSETESQVSSMRQGPGGFEWNVASTDDVGEAVLLATQNRTNLITLNSHNLTATWTGEGVTYSSSSSDVVGVDCAKPDKESQYLMLCDYTPSYLNVGDAIHFKLRMANWSSTVASGTVRIWFYGTGKSYLGSYAASGTFSMKANSWFNVEKTLTLSAIPAGAKYFLIGIVTDASSKVRMGVVDGSYAELEGYAAKHATNYMSFDSAGLTIGNKTSGSFVGSRAVLDNDSLDFKVGDTTVASYGVNDVVIGSGLENSSITLGSTSSSRINLCGLSGASIWSATTGGSQKQLNLMNYGSDDAVYSIEVGTSQTEPGYPATISYASSSSQSSASEYRIVAYNNTVRGMAEESCIKLNSNGSGKGYIEATYIRSNDTSNEVEASATILDSNGNTSFSGNVTAGGLIKSIANDNTVTVGSQNNAYAHFTSSSLPFYFNKQVEINGNLIPYGDTKTKNFGNTSRRWNLMYGTQLDIEKAGSNTTAGVYLHHGTANVDAMVSCARTDTGIVCSMGVGSGGTNHGLYSHKLAKWIVYADASNVYLNGNAATATNATEASHAKTIGVQQTTDGTSYYMLFANTGGSAGGLDASYNTRADSKIKYVPSTGTLTTTAITVDTRNGVADLRSGITAYVNAALNITTKSSYFRLPLASRVSYGSHLSVNSNRIYCAKAGTVRISVQIRINNATSGDLLYATVGTANGTTASGSIFGSQLLQCGTKCAGNACLLSGTTLVSVTAGQYLVVGIYNDTAARGGVVSSTTGNLLTVEYV